ncbi:MAG TPA: sugar transferase [Bacteroidetes bacterium]|nr:sugar transferase [Bacteroidota bacterium]
MKNRKQLLTYLFWDILSAALSWTLFFIFRKIIIEPRVFGYPVPVEFDERYFLGLVVVPVFWIFLYYTAGLYRNLYRRSILHEFGISLIITVLGTVVIFFTLILDDVVSGHQHYYLSASGLLVLHFLCSYLPRLIITTRTRNRIRNGKIGFRTLMIGSNSKAVDIYRELTRPGSYSGNVFTGFLLPTEKQKPGILEKELPFLGNMKNLEKVIKKQHIEEVIIAIESHEHSELEKIINRLERYDIRIRIIPNLFDILTGKVRLVSLFDAPLMEISRDIIPPWQVSLKRVTDISVSLLSLILLSPLCAVLAVLIKLDTRGPVIYRHERIGRFGKPFTIYKFRSMVVGAEENGPQLSSRNDPRVTRVGRFMRRTRLDEVPNFVNVLKGDMSLVGPRPERQYYIDRIVQRAPEYLHLQRVKPGITSLGQVKYGYAGNLDEMIRRMKYDLIYVENMSLLLDIRILAYTFLTIIRGRGI